ncbi:ATP synthase subunit epsilon [Musa troglodytarum]|uniref:ATP synthase subunit epsilon, mitochondrial n=1 Tax=Musa troglodytarum TaxID=320322 RepID=A0A9E7EGB4_9LILI|nr:ATP synthase subunit epsilon [Musa troglodytarum]
MLLDGDDLKHFESTNAKPIYPHRVFDVVSNEAEMVSAAAAAVPFWRAAGMTYITYSNICASLVRSCLEEPYKSETSGRETVHFNVTKWANGKPEKPVYVFAVSHSFGFNGGHPLFTPLQWSIHMHFCLGNKASMLLQMQTNAYLAGMCGSVVVYFMCSFTCAHMFDMHTVHYRKYHRVF